MFAKTEQAIIDRLKEAIPDVTVAPRSDLESIPEMRQKAPAVFVIYQGYTVGEAIANGTIQSITLEWYVVVSTKSARGNGNVGAARDQASDLCVQVLAALQGFHIGGGRYLRLADAPGPEYDGGYCYVPLAFTSAATFKGQP